MKNNVLWAFIIALLSFANVFGQQKTHVNLQAKESKIEVKTLRSDSFTLEASLGSLDFKNVSFSEGNYVTLETKGLTKIFETGMPNIPVLSKLIEVPQNASVHFVVKSYDEEIIKLADYGIQVPVAPAQRSQFKNESHVPFVKNENVYNTNDYIDYPVASYHESGQMRAYRLGTVTIRPIQYNPKQNTLRILNNLVVDVVFENADFEKTNALKKKYASIYFDQMLSKSVLNHVATNSRELITQAPTHMVIVSDPMFEAQLAPFIAWKVKKGFKVTVAYTDVIGSTTNDIKTYLQGIYEGSDPMSFVLFVGDVQQIPAWNGNSGSHVTDLRYCEYTGDNLPEVYYGRFSAQTTAQLQPQIDKSLMYEQFTMSDPSYLSEVFLVAGDDSSHEMTWGNGQIWYGDHYYFKADNNVNAHTYLQPLDNGAVHNIIINDINAGISFANYTAHCGPDGWSSPSFSTSDVNALTNNEKYGVWIGNCCLSVKFDDNECFGEAALRKENAGAIGDIGGSNSTLWDEDYWWGVGLTSSIVAEPAYEDSGRGAYDGLWHTEANESGDITTWYPAQGQIQVVGNLAVESSTSSNKEYYWEIYHLMGDPSIINYIGTPQNMTVTASPGALMLGMTSLNVTAAPYTYVALSKDGVLIAAALSDDAGNATLNFDSDALSVGTADLVVTGQNVVPYIGTISVTPADEAYVVLHTCTPDAPTNYGETVGLNVSLENVAVAGSGYDAGAVVATLSTTDPYITINDDTEDFGDIAAGAVVNIDGAFNISIADDVPDAHVATFDLTINGTAKTTWNATFALTLNAPELTIGSLSIDDTATGNGDSILDPGETADITIQVTNTGHADVSNVLSSISTTSGDLIINSGSAPATTLAVDETGDFTFEVSAGSDVAAGTLATITNDVTGAANNQYTAQQNFDIIIGFVPEYCESYATSTADSMIEEVQFGSVVNNTADEGCATYSDFTDDESLTDSFIVGTTNDIKIKLGTCGGTYTKAGKVFIDWNYDGDFDDDDEMVFATDIQNANWLAEGTFTVPEGVFSGPKFMRVVVSEDENNINPCGTYSWGETEDYKIYVYDPLTTDASNIENINVYPNPNTGSFTIDLRRFDSDASIQVQLFNINGQLLYQKEVSKNLFDVHVNEVTGIYFLRIRSGNQIMNKKIIISK